MGTGQEQPRPGRNIIIPNQAKKVSMELPAEAGPSNWKNGSRE